MPEGSLLAFTNQPAFGLTMCGISARARSIGDALVGLRMDHRQPLVAARAITDKKGGKRYVPAWRSSRIGTSPLAM